MDYQEVINFWFVETKKKQWWFKDITFDLLIKKNFEDIHFQAKVGELFHWRKEPLGRLAEIIILDQFSRNMFRDTPDAFACDNIALLLAQEAISTGADKALSMIEKKFLYMPYMHSESLLIHEVAIRLFSQEGLESSLNIEQRHKTIIDRFGRYPHRNAILGRKSNPAELEFLKQPNSGF